MAQQNKPTEPSKTTETPSTTPRTEAELSTAAQGATVTTVNTPSVDDAGFRAALAKNGEAMARNRFFHLFATPVFKASTNQQIYTNARSGLKSRQMAKVVLPFAVCEGAYTTGSVYARKGAAGGKTVIDFNFSGSMQVSSIETMDDDAACGADLIAFKAYVARVFGGWFEDQSKLIKAAGGSVAAVETVSVEGISID